MKLYFVSTKPTRMVLSPTSQSGQSMFEYLLISAIFAFALGIGMVDSTSPLRVFIEGFQTAYKNFSYALSLPN
jgi:hypothetical protein